MPYHHRIIKPYLLSIMLVTSTVQPVYALDSGEASLFAKYESALERLPIQRLRSAIFSDLSYLDNSITSTLNETSDRTRLQINIPPQQIAEHQKRFQELRKESFPRLETELNNASAAARERRQHQLTAEKK